MTFPSIKATFKSTKQQILVGIETDKKTFPPPTERVRCMSTYDSAGRDFHRLCDHTVNSRLSEPRLVLNSIDSFLPSYESPDLSTVPVAAVAEYSALHEYMSRSYAFNAPSTPKTRYHIAPPPQRSRFVSPRPIVSAETKAERGTIGELDAAGNFALTLADGYVDSPVVTRYRKFDGELKVARIRAVELVLEIAIREHRRAESTTRWFGLGFSEEDVCRILRIEKLRELKGRVGCVRYNSFNFPFYLI